MSIIKLINVNYKLIAYHKYFMDKYLMSNEEIAYLNENQKIFLQFLYFLTNALELNKFAIKKNYNFLMSIFQK